MLASSYHSTSIIDHVQVRLDSKRARSGMLMVSELLSLLDNGFEDCGIEVLQCALTTISF